MLQDRSLRSALELVAEQRPGVSPNAGAPGCTPCGLALCVCKGWWTAHDMVDVGRLHNPAECYRLLAQLPPTGTVSSGHM